MHFKIRFEKRESIPPYLRVLVPVVCVLLAFLFCGFIIRLQGFRFIEVYRKLFSSAFGSLSNLADSTLHSIVLMLTGLGVAMALKMSVNNIGAEGQYMMGAFAATGAALFMPKLPEALVLPCAMLFGFIGGALWGIISVLPRSLFGVNETIVTLMFNYVAIYFVNYWCYGPWRDAAGSNMPYTAIFPDYAKLRTLGNTSIHSGIFIAFLAAILIYLFYKHTVSGYEMRVIGNNQLAARYAGIDINKNILLVMLISGGLAGLAGATYVTGVTYRLQPEIANGYGYTAITIAYLARFNPFLVLLVSLLFGGLNKGGYSLQILGISNRTVLMIQGFILFFVLAGEIMINNRIVISRIGKGDSSQ